MRISNLIYPLVFLGFLLLLSLPSFIAEVEKNPIQCKQVEYKQRARIQVLTVCEDTLYDTGTAYRHETFQDTITTIRHGFSN